MSINERIADEIISLRNDRESIQDQVYIVAGVLGGICGVLVIAIIIMIVVAIRLKIAIEETEERRKIAAEIKERKFSAYTGEEVHRRMQTALPSKPGESEYAFNYPVNRDYKL